MIGNDIVDRTLASQESNWRRRGFLAKIFTAHEQHLIREAADPDQLVWLLWSMKESAYKVHVRTTANRVFAPIKLVCRLTELTTTTATGTVDCGGSYEIKSVLTPDYINTIAFSTDFIPAFTGLVVSFTDSAYQTQHRVIRERIKQHSSALLAVPELAIHIQKDKAGIPELRVGNSARLPLSISHHGRFGAYVIGCTGLQPGEPYILKPLPAISGTRRAFFGYAA